MHAPLKSTELAPLSPAPLTAIHPAALDADPTTRDPDSTHLAREIASTGADVAIDAMTFSVTGPIEGLGMIAESGAATEGAAAVADGAVAVAEGAAAAAEGAAAVVEGATAAAGASTGVLIAVLEGALTVLGAVGKVFALAVGAILTGC